MSTNILNWNKEKIGSIVLDKNIFEVEVKKELLQTVVHWQLASRRQGTHMVKTRAMVSGGGKKPFKQKGTGNARQGSTRSPLMPGGAKLFGPIPKSYSYSLPKQVRQLGLKMALSQLNSEGRLFVVDAMDSITGKTNELSNRLKKFGLKKAVLIDSNQNEKFKKASNNLPNFKYQLVLGMNVFDLLKYDSVVLTRNSVEKISERFQAE